MREREREKERRTHSTQIEERDSERKVGAEGGKGRAGRTIGSGAGGKKGW